MAIVDMIGGTTAAKLASARGKLSAATERLAKLEQQRADAVTAGDDIDAARKLDQQIVSARADLALYADRIAGLEVRLAQEEEDRRQRDQEAAIRQVEAMLPAREKAAAAYQRALEQAAAAAKALREASAAVFENWPRDLPRPFIARHHLNPDRAGKILETAFSPFVVRHPDSQRIIAGSEYLDRAVTAGERVCNFASEEKRHHDDLVAALREQITAFGEVAA